MVKVIRFKRFSFKTSIFNGVRRNKNHIVVVTEQYFSKLELVQIG